MRARAAIVLASLGLFGVAGCTSPPGAAEPSQPAPPWWAEEDKATFNQQQVALFVTQDPGWKAWLNALRSSERANDALVDASRYNTSVIGIIQSITEAQDAYKVATSFNLPPFTVTSSCKDLEPETNGAVQLSDGLTVRYSFVETEERHFDNGSYCVVSVGLINEIDSSRGLPIAAVEHGMPIDWGESFSRYLAWRQPYWTIATGTTLSQSDLVDLIER